MTEKAPKRNNENEHQTKRVFNSNEKKSPSLVMNIFLIMGSAIGFLILSALIIALVGFVAFYIVCGGEFGIKW